MLAPQNHKARHIFDEERDRDPQRLPLLATHGLIDDFREIDQTR
jgi:hypothetical protein